MENIQGTLETVKKGRGAYRRSLARCITGHSIFNIIVYNRVKIGDANACMDALHTFITIIS